MAERCVKDLIGYCNSPEDKRISEQEGVLVSLGGQKQSVPYYAPTCNHTPEFCPHFLTFQEHYASLKRLTA